MRIFLIISYFFGMATGSFAAAEADLLIAFDNSYTDGVGGDENAELLTANSVAASNWINEQSGSPARIRVCGFHKTWGQGGRSSLGGYIGWMANYGDGELNDVTAAADAAGADLVAFICAPAAGEGAAAVAQQPGRYAAYGPANFWNNVVAHESSGHNYGLDHRVGRENPKTIMMHNYCGGGSQPWFSNPNLWLNGARLLGEGSCIGAAVQGGDAAYHLSTSAQGVADRNGRVVWGSNLYPVLHRWQFNQAAGAAPPGTAISSSVGGALATVRGQGATFTGTGLRLPGGTTGNSAGNSISAYIDLPNGIFSSMPNFTVEIWATPLSARNWMRIIELGRTAQPGDGLGAAGEYTATPGSPAPGVTVASDVIGVSAATWTASLNDQRFLAGVEGTHQVADSNLATTAGEMHHYAITFADTTAGGMVKWFRDGALIKKLNVSFHSAALEDVNVWLGRSLWSGDEMAHIDYHDVRVQSVALKDGQVMANYLIGPHDAKSTLWAGDGYGGSGFVSGAWEFGGTPLATRDYETGTMMLRTPLNSNPITFPGKSLTITGGNLHLDATGAKTTTINDLRLNGGTIGSFGENDSTQTLAGNITVMDFSDNHFRGGWGPMVISANISGGVGGGSLLYTENAVTLTGDNSGYRGATIVGDGRFSTLRIAHETHLGGNPAFYGGDWLQLNRGILETTATLTIDDANRGVRIGPSGGFLRPAAGTTLTIASPITSPAAGNTLHDAPLDSNPIVGIFFKDGSGTLVLTNPNNSHNAEMQILQGELRLDGGGRLNNGDHWMPITLNSTLNYNSTATQTLRGTMSGSGALIKNNTGTLIINGANPYTGSVTINGGTLYANPGNAATNRAFSHVSGITVNNGGTLRTGPNGLFGWDGTQEKPITIHVGGILTANGGPGSDVGLGTLTLNGGTLATLAGGATDWGSWRFDEATDKLFVTANSTISATNVKFGSPAAAIEVLAGHTLNFTGTITNTTNGGTSFLRKTGSGTLTLAGSNTHTGATSLQAGTTLVNGSLGNTVVTVASTATLGGTGTVGGATTINGTHSPGTSAGTQTFDSTLNYGSTSKLNWELTSNSTNAGSFDKVTVSGAVSIINGAKIDVVLNASSSGVALNHEFWTQPRSWPFLTGSSISGSLTLGSVSNDAGGRPVSDYGTLSLQQNATSASLVFTPYTPTELWQQANFGENWNNPAIGGDGIDGDHDGLNNLLEYALGTNPNAFTSGGKPESSTDEGRLKISFTRNSAATDLTISVMAADELASTWTEIARSTNGAAFAAIAPGAVVNESGSAGIKDVEAIDVHLITDPAHPKRFMRLEVNR